MYLGNNIIFIGDFIVKKLIPINIQCIFMFIPFLNVLVVFMYLFNIHNSPNSGKLFAKSIIVFFASAIVPTIIFTIIQDIFVNLSVISFIEVYFTPFFIALNLINFQKKNMNFKD